MERINMMVLQIVSDTLTLGDYIFSGMSITMLEAGFIFATLGLLFRWGITARKGVRDKANNSPTKFNLKYWLIHNSKRAIASILVTVIALFIYFRFGGDYFGEIFSMGMAFFAGLGIDYIIDKIANVIKKKE